VIGFIRGESGPDETQGIAGEVAGGASNLVEQPDQQRLGLYLGQQERFIDRVAGTVDSCY